MNKDNLPQLINPLGDMIGLPQIIQNSLPEIPQASFQQNSIGLFFGNVKRNQLVKATKKEAEMAEHSNRSVKAKLDTIHAFMTFSAKVADTFGVYEHNKTMRALEVREKEADIYTKTAQAQLIGFEVKLSELDYKMKTKQYKDILGDDDE